ncbi:MAG: DUF2339 domain-containing protein [Caldilineaceae bacterium]
MCSLVTTLWSISVCWPSRFKQWSRLNLASFCFSAVAAAGWATTGYQSIYFGSTALFLALFFSFYLAISLWQALRRTEDDTDRKIDIGDVIILFANPLVSFLLFVGLFQEQRTWIAYGAVGLALLYGGLSYLLQRRQSARARFTSDSMFFFAAFFITLAIPLRFDAKLTAAIWSVMGVGLVWASIHRGQLLLRGWGLLVHLLAMGAFLVNWSQIPELRPALPPLTNHLYIGALIISVTLLMSGALLHRQRTHSTGSSAPLVWILLGVGLFWWYAGDQSISDGRILG